MIDLQKTLERGTEACGKVHDLVERIRFHIGIRGGPTKDDDGNYIGTTWPMMLQAADEIERLRSQLDNEQWQAPETTPQIELGAEKEYVVAVFRNLTGKVYSFAASYLNATPLRYEWGCPHDDKVDPYACKLCTDDGCPTTGWYRLTGDDGDGGKYESIDLRDGDRMMGWRELPRWKVALTDETNK